MWTSKFPSSGCFVVVGMGLQMLSIGCVPDAELGDERSGPGFETSTTGAVGTKGLEGPPLAPQALDDGQPPAVALPVLEGDGVSRGPEGCVHVSARVNEPATVTFVFSPEAGADAGVPVVEVPGRARADGAWEAIATLPGFLPGGPLHVSARAEDAQGRVTLSPPLALVAPVARGALVITEILANPAGSEYTQEFVELLNAGAASLSLAGFSLEDGAGADPLPDLVVPSGGRVVVVAEGFVEGPGADPEPAPGIPLVRVPGRLGRDGLSNAAEALTLRAPDGKVASHYGAWVDMSASAWNGRSTVRVPPDDPCDRALLWSDRPQPPTPGW
ncbi:MAG: lamin tail domain-containing protein [Myxococcales bacterium]|nr:lamin tail domain-containing protein [Myxococcales bacterium]